MRLPARLRPISVLLLGFLPAMLHPGFVGAGKPLEVDPPSDIVETARTGDRHDVRNEGPRWRAFLDRNPGWVARWEAGVATPVRAQGPGVPLGIRPQDELQADAAARTFLARNAGDWVGSGDLELVRAVRFRQSWWVSYSQTHQGLRVVGGNATLRIAGDGSVPRFGLNLADVDAVDPRPVLGEMDARVRALEGFPPDVAAEPGRGELVILPLGGKPDPTARLAWEVEFRTLEPLGAWTCWVDARDGRVLRRVNRIRYADLEGNVLGRVLPLQTGDTQTLVRQRYLDLGLFEGETEVAAGVAGPTGVYSLPDVPPGDHHLRVLLGGPYGVVINNTAGNTPTILELPVTIGTVSNLDVVFDDTNSRIQDRNAYHWSMVSRDYMQRLEAGFDLLDYPMPIVTDLANQSCNAFWDGVGINFFPAGNGCANTALSASVVIHEYGHGVTDFQYRPFTPSGAMHEGFSDYFSATVLNDPVIGHGFSGPGTSIRRIDVDRVWPDDVVQESHTDGLIIAGALWDARTALGATLADSLWHYARYGYADNFDDYFFDYLLTDDDDGNVYNGTPHFEIIVDAFRRHGIGDYSVSVAHQPLKDTEDTTTEFPLTARFLSLFALVDTSLTVHLELERGGGLVSETRAMVPTGEIREYRAILEAQPEGTTVRYWFTASDIEGTGVTSPEAGGSAPFSFVVGTDSQPPLISHQPLGDQPILHDSIRVRARITDNLDLGVNTPRLVSRVGSSPETEQEMVHLGEDSYEAVLSHAPVQLGDVIAYRIAVEDRAAIPNDAALPAEGALEFHLVRGVGHDFEVDDGGLTAEGGWEWGTPGMFQTAYSGEKVWATGLDGLYPNDTDQSLSLGPLDLTGFTRAGLFFRHTHDIESDYDGGAVYASADGGQTWDLILPDGEYPFEFLWATGEPGFSGKLDDWTAAAFDLTRYIGEADVRLRFRFASDTGLAGAGWFLDDVAVVERQVLARPLRLEARSGVDGVVPLSWDPPAGVPVDDPRSSLVGYRVYRSVAEGPYELLTPVPVETPAFTDPDTENGVFARYTVAAVYEDGESPATDPVEAISYVARFDGDTGSLQATAPPGGFDVREIQIGNTGTGFLKVAVWPSAPGRTLDQVRILYPILDRGTAPVTKTAGVRPAIAWEKLGASLTEKPRAKQLSGGRGDAALTPPTGEYELLFTDGDDIAFASIPDLKTLEAQVESGSLYLRLSAYQPWVDPRLAFTFALAMETDMNPDTGFFGDYTLLAGAGAQQQFGVLAVLLDGGLNPVAVPHFVQLAEGGTTAEFGFLLEDIGDPDAAVLILASMDRNAAVVYDTLPDAPVLPWLDLPSRSLEVFQGETGTLPVLFKTDNVLKGNYEAQLILETNDPLAPAVTVPLAFEVKDQTSVRLEELVAESTESGVELRWRVAEANDHLGFHVYRSDGPSAPELRLTGSLLAGDALGVHRFLDPTVEEGREYHYRIADLDRSGGLSYHGPVLVRYSGASLLARPVLRQNFPNPLRTGTTIRFGLPEATPVTLQVFGPRGSLIRTLAAGETWPRGFHELTWDGRDESHRAVSAGVYAYRLAAGGERIQRKLVVIR